MKRNKIKTKQSKYDITKNSKDKIIRTNLTIEKTNSKDTNQYIKSLDNENNKKSKNTIKNNKNSLNKKISKDLNSNNCYIGSYKNLINNNALFKNENKQFDETKKKNKEKMKISNVKNNKLNENKNQLHKNFKSKNNIKYLNIFESNKIMLNTYKNEKIKNTTKNRNEVNNNLIKDKNSHTEQNIKKRNKNNNNNGKNNNSKNEINMNYNYKSYINKINKLNSNIDYGIKTHSKKIIYYTLNNNKNFSNKKIIDINNLKTNYEKVNQIGKQEDNNKLLNNVDKKSSVKISNNKTIKKKSSMKYSLNNLMNVLENKKNKIDLNIERSELNILRIKKNNNKGLYCNYFNNNSINTKYIKSKNNYQKKIRTFLKLKPIKTNKKIEKSQLLIKGNFINNLTIYLDLLPKEKLTIPEYQKTSVFNTLQVDSKEKLKKI